MIIWNIKTNEAFHREWKEFEYYYRTEDYRLKHIFEIYLPFWQCKQNIVVEKQLELDRFSKILLKYIRWEKEYHKREPSHANICDFLGIEKDHFSIMMQLYFLKKNNWIRIIEPDKYEITHEGIEFLENKKIPLTMETKDFEYMTGEKYSFNDMTNDFFDFRGYKYSQTHAMEKEQNKTAYIKHKNKPTYRKVEEKRNDFFKFYNSVKENPNEFFYDFADNTLESHKRSICFLGFLYEKKERPDDIIIDIRQFEKTVETFKGNVLEEELSKKVTEYVKSDEFECKEYSDSASSTSSELSTESDDIYDKLVKAAEPEHSKIDQDGYILMNEFAQTCKSLGIGWDRDAGFKKFLENHNNIIEFKPNTPFNAPAIRIIPKISEKTIFLEQKLKDVDKIYIDTCSLMETPIEKFFEKANPILKKYNKKIIVLSVVIRELKKITNSEKYELEKRIKAKAALKELNPINEIELSNEEDDNEIKADHAFKIIFERYRKNNKMLLITQDSPLSNEILNTNNSRAVPGKKCVVCRVNDEGYLCDVINV